MTENISLALIEIIQTELHWEQKTLPKGALAEQLDSIQRLSLMVAIEDHFTIIFSQEDEERIDTIDDVILLIEEKIEEKQ